MFLEDPKFEFYPDNSLEEAALFEEQKRFSVVGKQQEDGRSSCLIQVVQKTIFDFSQPCAPKKLSTIDESISTISERDSQI